MSQIWKFPVPITGEFSIAMPIGARILDIQVQNGEPCLWALVTPSAQTLNRRFRMFGTGQPIDIDLRYYKHIGTYLILNDNFVGHVFTEERHQ